ncbi:hypothetical protein L914_02247 [Phytophthora nicotianae]|uniref:Uncharacterized protein n=2 Tax=Phytophthora nicotianae TaxID=4792 RepID=V9FWZ2_PHYNI|nr:hypothetical protein F443_02367 [Phytophthora nicotianae P1569]ETM54408.1 hypothetical protein L914_02247 [Phytophthora nicotianae]
MDSIVLLQAVAGVARAVRSLYGPNKLRKQVTDELDQTLFTADTYTVASVLQSQNAGTAILQQALDDQQKEFGTGCTTLVTLCGVLAETVLEMLRQGLPTDIIQQALSTVEKCSLITAKHMRVPLTEAIPSFQTLIWTRQLEALGLILGDKPIATSLAVKAAMRLDPVRFCDENVSLSDLVTAHVVLGGVTSAVSSQVFDGVLLPVVDAAPRNALWRRFSSNFEISITGGIVILTGDLDTLDFAANSSVRVIFVHGDVSTKVVDASISTPNAPVCIPVSSYNSLIQLAEMSGAEIVDSWAELLPSAIGCERLQLKSLERSVSGSQDEEVASFFVQVILCNTGYQPHTSVIVQGPTKSLAEELRGDTHKMISRLRNALRSGYVLPGNGGFWCACAATVEQQAESLGNQELLSFAAARLTDPLIQLGVILLENSPGNDSFFSRLALIRRVQKRFIRSVQDVGATKFYSRYYDYRNAQYAVLALKTTEPESEDGRVFHVDEYKSMISAIRKSFRVIQLLLSIDRHHIN